jgi:hypothetical protein
MPKQDGAEWQKIKYVKRRRLKRTVPSARGADKKMGHYIEQPGLLLLGDLQITLWDKIYILGGGNFLVGLLREILLDIVMHTVLSCIKFHHANSCNRYFVPSCTQLQDALSFTMHFVLVPSCIWSNHAFGSIMHDRCVICIPQASASSQLQAASQFHYAFQ